MNRKQAQKDRTARERQRVARFLSGAPAGVRAAAKEGSLLLEGNRGTIAVRTALLTELLRAGVLSREGETVRLTAEGEALVKRSGAGDEPFREQHMEIVVRHMAAAETGATTVRVNLDESPLAQLARRRNKDGRAYLNEAEFRAGERLRADYTRGQIMPRLGANWGAAVASGRRGSGEGGLADLTDAALAARQRVDKALAAVGPELAGVLVDVCCFLKGLEKVEAEREWPVRSAKVVLKAALSALSRHYEPQAPQRRRPILHWGARDYRPSLR